MKVGGYRVLKWLTNLREYIKSKWWYITLLIFSTLYVFDNRYELYQLSELNSLSVIFLAWIFLLILPLFSEMEILGLKFKREIKDSISELKYQIIDMKLSNSNSNSNVSNNYFGSLPNMDEIKKYGSLNKSSNDTKDDDLELLIRKKEEDIPNKAIYLFQVRYIIERKLITICELIQYNGSRATIKMLQHIMDIGLLDIDTIQMISDVLRIANRGIHTDDIDDDYIFFVSEIIDHIETKLDNLIKRQRLLTTI